MSAEREDANTNQADDNVETDTRTSQPVEEEEKNLSRHSTSDSSPSIAEQERTTVPKDEA
ncbi:MAG TPA: hypothetical protein VF658_07950 [Pyrinomonadaceae bacterium]|jgi:hypothetical protein